MKISASILASLATGMVIWSASGRNELYGAIGGLLVAIVMLLPAKKSKPVCKLAGLEWNEAEMCHNFLIVGALGSGKTNAMFNIMDNLFTTVPGFGGLFMDEKGEDHLGLLRLAEKHGRRDDVIIIQVAREGQRFYPLQRLNLLTAGGMGDRVASSILADISYQGSSRGKSEGFFKHQTLINLSEGMRFLRYKGHPVTTSRLRDFLCSEMTMMKELEPFLPTKPKENEKPKVIDPRDQAIAMQWYENYISQPGDQRGGVISSIANALAPFNPPEIAEVFSSEEPDTVDFSSINKGKILCVLCPSAFPVEKAVLNQYFKSLYFNVAADRFDRRVFGEEPSNLLVAFLDEYQNSAASSDKYFLSKLRSARCCFLAATQDTESLVPVMGADNAKVIVGKFRNRIIFTSESSESAQSSSNLLGKKDVWKKSYSSGGKGGSTSRSQVEEPILKSHHFNSMPNWRCVILHTNKKFRKNVRLPVV